LALSTDTAIALGALVLSTTSTVGAIIWFAARTSAGQESQSRSLHELSESVKQLAGAMADANTANAVQNTRLDNHDRRLDGHDEDIDSLRRGLP
jgi:hypothetical protein